MEFEILALRAANAKCSKEKTVESAENVCIESRACVMAFIDDSTWVGQVVEKEKTSVQGELEFAQRVLGFVEPASESEISTLTKLKNSISKRYKQVLDFKIGINPTNSDPTLNASNQEEPDVATELTNPKGNSGSLTSKSQAMAQTTIIASFGS